MDWNKTLTELRAQHEALITKKNRPVYCGGVYERYENPVLTAAHAPLEWRYDLDPKTNPFLMERIGIHAAFNSGAIKWGDKYVLVVRVEADDRKSFFAVAESPNGVDNFRFWPRPVTMPEWGEPATNVYDMRLTRHEDGWIYGLFCVERKDHTLEGDLSAATAACGIARTKDLVNWERLPDLKSASQQRNVCLHPEFVDGKYAPAHRTSTGVHPRNISYVISSYDAARLYAEDEQFHQVLNSGRFSFVDNFFCIDSPEFIETRNGEKHLTRTALSQIEKCCLSFRIEYKSKTSYFDKTGLHSNNDIGDPIATALSSIPIEMLIESQADIEEKCADLPSSYGDTLIFHREKKGMSQDDLAWALGIKPDTLRDYEHSLLFEPSRIFFASVGRILKLPGYYTKDMMNKANCSLEFSRDQMKHLDFIVTFMYMRSLEDCNAMAAHFHLPPFLGRSDEEIAQGRKLRNGKITRKRDIRVETQQM